jgi:hypothetical protein
MWGGGVVVKAESPFPSYALGGNRLDRLLSKFELQTGGRIRVDRALLYQRGHWQCVHNVTQQGLCGKSLSCQPRHRELSANQWAATTTERVRRVLLCVSSLTILAAAPRDAPEAVCCPASFCLPDYLLQLHHTQSHMLMTQSLPRCTYGRHQLTSLAL